MAIPFYNQVDQDIYTGGEHYIPQEQYRLNYTPSTALASTVGGTGGVTGTQAANPYLYPQGGGGGGGGRDPFGPTREFDVRSWDGTKYVDKTITGHLTPSGWKTEDDKNIFHGGMFKNDLNRNIGDIEETETDWSKLRNLSPINFIRTKYRNWKEKKAAKEQKEKTASGVGATTGQGGAIKSEHLRDIGDTGFHEYTSPEIAASYEGTHAQGGRIGYQNGEFVEDVNVEGPGYDENVEEVQGEPSREQLEAIALEIFQLPLEQLNEEQLMIVYQAAMEQEPSEEGVQFAAEGPGEGIASLV